MKAGSVALDGKSLHQRAVRYRNSLGRQWFAQPRPVPLPYLYVGPVYCSCINLQFSQHEPRPQAIISPAAGLQASTSRSCSLIPVGKPALFHTPALDISTLEESTLPTGMGGWLTYKPREVILRAVSYGQSRLHTCGARSYSLVPSWQDCPAEIFPSKSFSSPS